MNSEAAIEPGPATHLGVQPLFTGLGKGLGWMVNISALGSATIVLILMVLVTADVTGRYLFSKPVPMTYEVGAFMLVFVVFLGMAYTQRMGAHIRVEFVTLRLPAKAPVIMDLVAFSLGILLYGAIFYQGFKWAYEGFQIFTTK